ncbi:GNAT family N-acetyltransferase [Clostridium sp. D2Q-11]|uniref:GNAT family N-acetyltransferase n=1 Tax=Anaeromonas frigoriresistens TaxID=2683708 RepID=A0A942UTR7_9FIRM|nr:GNAT family N-acetyltransferase [Anaeromonas frigoriresistens]
MNVELKLVNKRHCELLYEWANDELVREHAFNTEQIDYGEHKKWFENKINSPNTYIYIAYIEEIAIGQIRIDIEDDIGFIDYSIDKEYRGKGYGTTILKKIVEKFVTKDKVVKMLVGKVKIKNTASQKAFKNSGYTRNTKNDTIEYYINLTKDN